MHLMLVGIYIILALKRNTVEFQIDWEMPFWLLQRSFKLIQQIYLSDTTKCVCLLVSSSATPWTVAFQAPLSMGFSRHKHWSGLPFPSPGSLPDPGIKPSSLALQVDSLLSELSGKPQITLCKSALWSDYTALSANQQ